MLPYSRQTPFSVEPQRIDRDFRVRSNPGLTVAPFGGVVLNDPKIILGDPFVHKVSFLSKEVVPVESISLINVFDDFTNIYIRHIIH